MKTKINGVNFVSFMTFISYYTKYEHTKVKMLNFVK